MIQKQKEILLKDISARLPYGIKAEIKYYDGVYKLQAIYTNGTTYATRDVGYPIETYFENCKPFLFPMSSMTEEQEKDIFRNGTFFFDRHNTLCCFPKHNDDCDYVTFEDYLEITEKLNKHHIDYRGLIDKGLAINCTNLNIY